MFHNLKYRVTFPSTNRTLTANLEFEPGFHAITGSNEAGKTMILEMLRFLLFGSLALRGKADDYKSLTAGGEFTIKGVRYRVDRTTKKAFLFIGEDMIASGVTPVNEKIFQLLGFGIGVFDMACSINQGEVERLGSLSPGERKRLVDGVLGIDALELVAKWGMEEAKILDREAATLRAALFSPQQPTPPTPYVPSATIDLPGLRRDANELATIEGWLSRPMAAPSAPSSETFPDDLERLAEEAGARRRRKAELETQIATLPTEARDPAELDFAERDWGFHDTWVRAQAWLRDNPAPTYTRNQLGDMKADHALLAEFERFDRAQHQLAHLQSVDCPECSHSFPLDAQEADRLRAITEPGAGRPQQPPLSLREIETALLRDYDYAEATRMGVAVEVARPSIERHMIPTYRAQIDQHRQRLTLMEELFGMPVEPDYEIMLMEKRSYDAALATYTEALKVYEAWVLERDEKASRAAVLADVRQRLSEAEAAHAAALYYEQALERFAVDYDRYTTQVADAEAKEAKAIEFRKVRDVMTVLRSLIKQHLMPSLNRVASHLLQQMTGGQRNAIYVDEDFNVIVDRQPLDTLSGSGKACANLALRIALGQVLTNRVFSVLLADEIDASMDDFRAEQTSNVLYTLENSISQVLLVSHKSIEAINHIDLGALNVGDLDAGPFEGEAA